MVRLDYRCGWEAWVHAGVAGETGAVVKDLDWRMRIAGIWNDMSQSVLQGSRTYTSGLGEIEFLDFDLVAIGADMAALTGHLTRCRRANTSCFMAISAITCLCWFALVVEGGVGMAAAAGATSRRQTGPQYRRCYMAETALVMMNIDDNILGAIRVVAGVTWRLHDDVAEARVIWWYPVTRNNGHGGRFWRFIGRSVGGVVTIRTMDCGACLTAGNDRCKTWVTVAGVAGPAAVIDMIADIVYFVTAVTLLAQIIEKNHVGVLVAVKLFVLRSVAV